MQNKCCTLDYLVYSSSRAYIHVYMCNPDTLWQRISYQSAGSKGTTDIPQTLFTGVPKVQPRALIYKYEILFIVSVLSH